MLHNESEPLHNTIGGGKRSVFLQEFKKNQALFLMLLPGLILTLFFSYLPMAGIVVAFKNFTFHGQNFFQNFSLSKWVGFNNFKFFLNTSDSFTVMRNTIGYNLIFIILGTTVSVLGAVSFNELRNRRMAKFYQTSMLLPYFLSWVAISYLFFAFLNEDKGIINIDILKALGLPSVRFYSATRLWPFILIFANIFKYAGYNCIVYLAAVTGIDPEFNEVAALEGATKWQQITKITIPLISPTIIMMVLIAIGRIVFADFGLFFNVPMNSGLLYNATNVLDTYVYRGLMTIGDIGMSSAAGVFQSFVGFIFVLGSNLLVNKIDSEKAIF